MSETNINKNRNSNAFKVTAIPAFTDNYIWCLHKEQNAVVVDPGEAKPVLDYLQNNAFKLTGILVTHHHFDHVGGIETLLQAFPNIPVFGPNNPKITSITNHLIEDDSIVLPEINAKLSILETPGHTLDHIVYFDEQHLFCGDTLFSGGCGRMFEGTPPVFWHSLQKLMNLPSHLGVYCTHEYTQANLAFAQHVDPHNEDLKTYSAWVDSKRAADQITLPSSIAQEIAINPFLRCGIDSDDSSYDCGNDGNQDKAIAKFADLRKQKDNF